MREIKTHETSLANQSIAISADDWDEKYGNTSHAYAITFVDKEGRDAYCSIEFQRGPIKEVGVNGITNEALLAILIDRLDGFQSGPFRCDENDVAREHLLDAMAVLKLRTKARLARGVEGTNVV